MTRFDPFRLNPRDFVDSDIPEETILHWLDCCDAFWRHDGDPARPHAELSGGACSNAYVNLSKVLCYPTLTEIMAQQLVKKLHAGCTAKDHGWTGFSQVDWVVGSPYAAITFSYEVAKLMKAIHGFAEKDHEDPKKKKMLWPERFSILKGKSVLQVEELITTSGTFQEVRRAICQAQHQEQPVLFMPIVATIVHRPPKLPAHYDGVQVVSLVEMEVWAVPPEECPLCKAGSQRVRPKSHWGQLTGRTA